AWIANAGQGGPGPAVAEGLVFVAGSIGNSHRLLAFDATTGDMAWSHRVDFDLPSPPAVQGGRVFDVSPVGTVYALDAATGARVWTASVGGSDASPAVAAAGGALFVASESGVTAFDASNAWPLWSMSVDRKSVV